MKKRKEPNKKNIQIVKELKELIENKRTIFIASIKNLPASQFQEISKKLRGKAIVKVPKKNLIIMALGSEGKAELKKLEDKIKENIVILFSDLDSFELAGELFKNKSPAKAKAGQEAPEDIEIEPGPTDLVPGPAISDLGALGIQVKIEKGKIHIKEPKIIAKKGEKISKDAAEIMSKLNIKPFSTGFIPLCAFDNKEKKFYANLKIDTEGTLKELKADNAKALSFAIKINYMCKDTIKVLISQANNQANKLNKLIKGETEVAPEEPKKEEPQEVKEEPKKEAGEGLASLFG